LVIEKLALVMVQVQFPPPQPFKNGLLMPHIFLWYFAKNDHNINVTPKKRQTILVHHSLKLTMRILEAKWKKLPMVQFVATLTSSPLFTWSFFHLNKGYER
jgi:hypothetical protein